MQNTLSLGTLPWVSPEVEEGLFEDFTIDLRSYLEPLSDNEKTTSVGYVLSSYKGLSLEDFTSIYDVTLPTFPKDIGSIGNYIEMLRCIGSVSEWWTYEQGIIFVSHSEDRLEVLLKTGLTPPYFFHLKDCIVANIASDMTVQKIVRSLKKDGILQVGNGGALYLKEDYIEYSLKDICHRDFVRHPSGCSGKY
ncbi:hypothetical protein COV24_02430 [candidate division WWE3 bacterium CG10_big_fil_rev_8_21_14_0_10_32_10]|uniref:Uncharacterized protein n=1 Tax=candidate division WWE3 bacterium CG10_big_fil_rev_8_21_14_0_10_32_10 TaxID=1975090 RepID=A0A2H0RAC2_UNCKA|nr:MAG: hypothetical protein COV24_02430 [candidate division WWE3 bacterium CG10_big_fil_rev_8_21_14_0_10_32_10]